MFLFILETNPEQGLSEVKSFLTRMGKLVPEKTLLCLFSSVIPPELNYRSIVWLFIRASTTVERMFKKGLRTIVNDKKASLPNLYSRRLHNLAILMFKMKNEMSIVYF